MSAWAISLYALMLAVATAVYGRISDLVGVRIPLAVGVGLMTAGALAGALAPSFGSLLVARIVQGAGAAAVPTLGVAIISARYSGSVRGMALGRVAGFAAAVSCIGPLAGGVIEGLLDWRAVIALPMLGALLLPLLWRSVPTEGSGARLDLFGAALVAGTAAGVVLLVQSPSTGPTVAIVGAALAVLGVPAVAAWVRRRPNGFLPVTVIRNPAVVRSALAAAAVPAAWFALLIAVPAVLVARRLGALAGRRRTPAERRGRPDGSPLRRSAAHPGGPGPGTGAGRDGRSCVAAGCSAGRVRRLRLAAGDRRGGRDPGVRARRSRP